MTKPSRLSATRTFATLREGDIVYSIHHNGKRVFAIIEKVAALWVGGACPARGGLFKTLSHYADGTCMLYFGMWFRRQSGIEYGNWQFQAPVDRPRVRLYLELPAGVHAVSHPGQKL